LFFTGSALTGCMWWSVRLWPGTIVLGGAVGWRASWLVVPPPVPVAALD